jgi:hypothetical protein
MYPKVLLIVSLVSTAAALTGCPMMYRGYHGYDGRVLDARKRLKERFSKRTKDSSAS